MSATIVPVVYFYYPETTGLSMEELEDIWKASGPRGAVRETRRLRANKRAGIAEGKDASDVDSIPNEKEMGVTMVEKS